MTQTDFPKGFVIVRTYTAGVFACNIRERNGLEAIIDNAIRLHWWEGADSLSQLAMEGTKLPDRCRFAMPVNGIHLTQVIEILPCTAEAEANIKGVKTWKI